MNGWLTRYRSLLLPLAVVFIALVLTGGRCWSHAPWVAGGCWVGAVLLLREVIIPPRRGG